MKTISVNLYQFDELDDEAKKVARDWFKEDYPDHSWWDGIFDTAKEIATHLGIEIQQLHFCGFWSQGDGACFTGTFRSADLTKTTEEFFKSEYPTEKQLHALLRRLLAVKHREDSVLKVVRSGYYTHSNTMYIEDPDFCYAEDEENEILNCLRSFADWIYKALEKAYEELMSDECVDEDLRSNEYWFLADGQHSTLGD